VFFLARQRFFAKTDTTGTAGNTKRSITVRLTSCLTGLD